MHPLANQSARYIIYRYFIILNGARKKLFYLSISTRIIRLQQVTRCSEELYNYHIVVRVKLLAIENVYVAKFGSVLHSLLITPL